jgi:DNA-binding transcriptional ArsR family regulator
MKTLEKRAESYLAELDTHMGPIVPRVVSSLPLFLRERFSVFSVKLFGHNWLLAVEVGGWEPGTPAEYRQHWNQLKQATRDDRVAIVLPFVSATVRNRMVHMGIPFIIPDTQLFLPECITLLTESYGVSLPERGRPLSPAAQVLLLMQVEKGGLEELSAKELSARLGYSRASMSIATSELEQNQLCETYRKGKEQRIIFKGAGKSLWEAGLPLLRSPVVRTLFVTWTRPLPDAKRAGISSLAKRSQLDEDPTPVFALPEKRIRQGLEQGLVNGCADRYGADAQVEVWRYDAASLSDGPDVDPLSLYLSLRKDPDERVQAALAVMMEDVAWR